MFADCSHAQLTVQGYAPLPVLAFHSSKERHVFSSDYALCVMLHQSANLKFLGKKAVLQLFGQYYIHGIIAAINGKKLRFCSPLYPLKLNIQSRTFIEQDIQTIIQTLLRFYHCRYRLINLPVFAPRAMTLQINETDFDFLYRQLAYYGLGLYLLQTKTHAEIYIGGDLSHDLQPLRLAYAIANSINLQQNCLYAIKQISKVLTSSVSIDNHCPEQPHRNLQLNSQAQQHAYGNYYSYGERHYSLSEGITLCRLRQEALDWQRQQYLAKTNQPGLQVGQIIELHKHPWPTLNAHYRIINMAHRLTKDGCYENSLTLIKASQSYRPVFLQTPVTHVGYMHAKLSEILAPLDEKGCYIIDYFFTQKPISNSSRLRRLQPLVAGVAKGMHLPLQQQQEVLLACLNSNIDLPIIAGFLPDPNHANPVTVYNNSQHRLQTWGGQSLLMEDKFMHERIDLANQQQLLSLVEGSQQAHILLQTPSGALKVKAGKNLLMQCNNSHQTAAFHQLTVNHQYNLTCQMGTITQQIATHGKNKAGNGIEFKAQHSSQLVAKQMLWHSQTDFQFSMQQGGWGQQIILQAHQKLKLQGEITIKQGHSSIHLSPSGTIVLQASKVIIHQHG
jgi:uncharacterized protein involved in type VI secretion and phage assembly